MKINKLTNEKTKKIIFILLLFAITLSLFQYTVKIRKPWFGTLSWVPDRHQWLSGSTLKFTKNWYREGPLNLKFGMIENPKSVEFPTLSSRVIYPSFPPGTILPIYLISKLRGQEPTPSLLMSYNLLNHFLIAFFLSLIIFFFLLQLKFSYLSSFILSIIPISLELLLPAPLYWHQNVFFAEQAVILPFVLFIFFEVIRGNIRSKKIFKSANFLQGLVLFYGILTDWLFIFVAATVYLKRILNKEMGESIYSCLKMNLKYWFPVILALSLFVFQLYSLGIKPQTMELKILYRTGLTDRGETNISKVLTNVFHYTTDINFYNAFWKGYIAEAYGKIAIYLLWGSLFLFLLSFIYVGFQYFRRKQIDEKIKKTLSLIAILLIPCFLQVCFFANHSAIHNYSALKFSIPLVTVPFILIPILIFSFLKIDLSRLYLKLEALKIPSDNRKKNIKLPVIILCLILLAGVYLKKEYLDFKNFFPEPDKSFEVIGEFISANTQYKDVVFSPNFAIPSLPPQQLSYSMKRVYMVNSIFDIYSMVKNINENFEVNIFSINKNIDNKYGIKELTSVAYDIRQANNFYLYKIKSQEFFERYDELKNTLNSPYVDAGFSQSNNPLEVIFASDRPGGIGGSDLYRAERPSAPSNWLTIENIENITELNSEYGEHEPKIRFDGLEIFFVSTRLGGTGGLDIWVSTRGSPDRKWSPPVPVSEINSEYDEAGPWISTDGLIIYFHSTRPGGSGWCNIYKASRPNSVSPFSPPVIVSSISSSSDECMPFLSPDQLTLYFISNRPGGEGGWDIWWSRRPTKESDWSTPRNLKYVNSEYSESSPFFSPRDNVLYFGSTRPGGLGEEDIWATSIPVLSFDSDFQ